MSVSGSVTVPHCHQTIQASRHHNTSSGGWRMLLLCNTLIVLEWHLHVSTLPAPRLSRPRAGLTHKYQYRSQSTLQLAAAARSGAGFIEFFVPESNIFGPHAGWCRLVRPSLVTGVGGNYESWLIATFIIAAEFSLILPAAGTYLAWHHSGCRTRRRDRGQSAHFKYLWFALKSYLRLHSSLPQQSVSIVVIRWLLLKASF